MDEQLKRKVEAVIFSAGKKITVAEITKLVGRNVKESDVIECLQSLKNDYEHGDSSMMIYDEGESWKLTIRDDYIPVVRRMGTETELTKTVMETLAVIAFKAPVLQSDVIKIRTNKAYDHIKELEESGYITRKREGRTKRIDLTQRFFDYFDLPAEELKKRFQRIRELQDQVEYLEKAAKERQEEKDEKAAAAKDLETQHKEEFAREAEELDVALSERPTLELDKPQSEEEILEQYKTVDTYTQKDSEDASPVKEVTEHLGNLEVVDEPPLPEDTVPGKEWGSLKVVKMKEGEEPETTEETEEAEEKEEKEEKEEQPVQQATANVGVTPSSKVETEETAEPSKTEEAAPEEKEAAPEEPIPEPTTLTHEDVKPKEAEETEGMFAKGMSEDVKKKVASRVDELLHPEKEQERKTKEAEQTAKRLQGIEEEKKESDKKIEKENKEVAAPDKESAEGTKLPEGTEEEPSDENVIQHDEPTEKKSETEISEAMKNAKND